MKKTYFLDKIYNANYREFDSIMNTIIKELHQENNPYTYFKNGDNWLLEIERENDLVYVLFNDYIMEISNSTKPTNVSYSSCWQNIIKTFLTKKQNLQYCKNLLHLEAENVLDTFLKVEDSELNSLNL